MSNDKSVIIIGGGIAGKLAARVLSDYFTEVTILERDAESERTTPRKGAKQGEHLHALLHAGQYGLEELFPGITEKFYRTGAVKINSTKDLSWLHHGVWKLRYDGGYTTTLQTRPHLEWHMEQYIKQIPNITYQHNVIVKNYLFYEKENQIYGVELQDSEQSTKTLTADLIVDTSGASSITTSWLDKRNISIPSEKVDIGLSYVSQLFHLQDNPERDWKIKLVYPNPPYEKIGGTISTVEDNRFMVTLIGYQNAIQEKDVLKNENGFLEIAKKLPATDIYHEIKDATPLTKASIYRVPQIKWKRFDKVKQLPNGLLLMGDTVCRIDPVFGQGMSIAVLEALALQRILSENNASLQGVITDFHKKTAKIIAPIWNMVLIEDFRYPNIVGKKPPGLIVQQWFSKNIFLLSAQNQHIYDTFIKVMNLVKPTAILMHPKIILSVIKRNLGK